MPIFQRVFDCVGVRVFQLRTSGEAAAEGGDFDTMLCLEGAEKVLEVQQSVLAFGVVAHSDNDFSKSFGYSFFNLVEELGLANAHLRIFLENRDCSAENKIVAGVRMRLFNILKINIV